jgi:hypothetical protein
MKKIRIFEWDDSGFANPRDYTGLDSICHLRDQLTSVRKSFTSDQINEELKYLEKGCLVWAEKRIKDNFKTISLFNHWLDLLGQIPNENTKFEQSNNQNRVKAFVDLVLNDIRQNKNQELYQTVTQIHLPQFIYTTFEDIHQKHNGFGDFFASDDAKDLDMDRLGIIISYLNDDPTLDVEKKMQELKESGLAAQKTFEEWTNKRSAADFSSGPQIKIQEDRQTEFLEARKQENRYLSAVTSSEAQTEIEKNQSSRNPSPQRQLPWRDILGAAILLGCLVTFAWAANSLLQFFS